MALRAARKNYYGQRIQNADNKSKCAWNIVNKICGRSKKCCEIQIEGDPKQIVNDIYQYFINSGPFVRSKSNNNTISSNAKTMYVYPVLSQEIITIIQNLKNKKSTGFDEISNNIIKYCNEEISASLSFVIQNSSDYGIFPEQLKRYIQKR
ncbi:hypothetical protein TcasGA2_TC010605 [Tribolium castaneum]|uniref:Uncharacterized protein n=1 Tax=Tribolium castaneum TaxID=7070 RepID=D6X3P9_TRICA|nr:hypothetical protein TcasGA2_TC011282 [Tribolium castaneum]EFA13285.1 hypothetical protein TcasGA2_TC010605 [Tribolium castaneum]